jgi:hypothetical protein
MTLQPRTANIDGPKENNSGNDVRKSLLESRVSFKTSRDRTNCFLTKERPSELSLARKNIVSILTSYYYFESKLIQQVTQIAPTLNPVNESETRTPRASKSCLAQRRETSVAGVLQDIRPAPDKAQPSHSCTVYRRGTAARRAAALHNSIRRVSTE